MLVLKMRNALYIMKLVLQSGDFNWMLCRKPVLINTVYFRHPSPTTIPHWIYRFSSDHRSQAVSGPVSTWMGDRLGIPGVVGFCFCLLDVANVIFLSLFPSKSIDALSMKQFAFYSTWSPKQNTFKMALKFSSFKCIHYITGCCRLLLLLIKCGKCHIFVLIPFIIYRRYINEAICLLFHLKSWKKHLYHGTKISSFKCMY